MQIATTPLKRCTLVNQGRFDSNTSRTCKGHPRKILGAVFRIVLDMEGVEFFGSAAVRVLVMTYRIAALEPW